MAQKIRVLLVNHNQDSLASLKNLLGTSKEFKLSGEARNGKEALEMTMNFQPDIVVMSVHLPIINGFEAATKITKAAPYIGVILIGPAESVEVIRHAMQSGAGDFLELPINGKRLSDSIVTLYNIKQEQRKHLIDNPLVIPERRSKVISVFSSKGGVGKTVIATNLAVALREQTREDVLLIDLDLQFGDVADLLNMEPKISIVDLITDKDNIELSEMNKYILAHHSGVRLLPAPQQPEQADLVNGDDVKEIVSLFLKTFDYIVIDLPPLFNEVTLGTIEISDHILLISTMEIPTLKNIKGGLDILRKLECSEDKISLILNRFDDHREIKVEDIKKFLGKQELIYIDDNSELVSTAINIGEPLVLSYKESPVAKQIINLSRSMIDYRRIYKKKERMSLFQKFKERGKGK